VIYGIGTDIVRVARIARAFENYGERFASRILTDVEYKDFQQSKKKPHFLAKRFAAKEATVKAMGTGFSHGIYLSHIGVAHDHLGKPRLIFSGGAADVKKQLGIGEAHVSLSDEEDYALAFVTLLRV